MPKPPFNLTDSYAQVARYLYNWALRDKEGLGFEDVFYGDQDLVPRTPALAIEPGPTIRELAGAQFAVNNNFTMFFLIYHSKVADSQVTRMECDEFAVRVQDFLHTDKILADTSLDPDAPLLVASAMVSGVDPGYVVRDRTLMRVTRLTWTALSKTIV